MYAQLDADEDPISDRPTAPPPEAELMHASGVRRRAEPDDSLRPSQRGRIDVRYVPLIVDKGQIGEPHRLITAMLVATINGVLSIADLAEVTGIPLGAVADSVLELTRSGAVVLVEPLR